MKKTQNNKAWFLLYILLVGGTAATLSVISDNIRYMIGNIPPSKFFITYVAITFNSLPVWFLLAMGVGHLFGKSIKSAAVYGSIYTLTTITLYYVFGALYNGTSIFSVATDGSLCVLLTWYIASLLGGILGGVTGFIFKRKPYTLLIFSVGIIIQLYLNDIDDWVDTVVIAQNATYCVMLAASLRCFYIIDKKKENLN
ncbi:hypothetical protein C1N61_29460 (plasmid) [Priestia aryabhattai]